MPSTRDVIAGKASVQFGADFGPLRKGMQKLDNELNNVGKRLQEVSTKFVQIGIASGYALSKAIEVGAKYEDQISQIKNLLGGTGVAISGVEVEVRKLGATTSFTSSEVAGAFVELKRGGLTAQQAVDSLRPSLSLARAGTLELATASRLVASSIKAFNLEGDDAVRVTDLLVTVANKAGTNVEELGEALKFVALSGKGSGESIEDVVKTLGLLGDSALRGGNAGRNLSRALERIASPEAQDKIRKLGVAVNSIDPETGKAESFLKVIQKIKTALKGLSNKDQSAILLDIFDVQGKRAVQAILSRTTAEMDNLQSSIANMNGTAGQFAKEMDKNIGGSLRFVVSAIQDTAIELSKALAPAITEISTMIIGLSQTITGFIKENKGFVATIAVTGTAITVASVATLGFGVALQGLALGIGVVNSALGSLAIIVGINTGPLNLMSSFIKKQSIVVRGLHFVWSMLWKLLSKAVVPILQTLKLIMFDIFKVGAFIFAGVAKAVAVLGGATVGLVATTVAILGYTIYDQIRDKSNDSIATIKEQIRIQKELENLQNGIPLSKKGEELIEEKGSVNQKLDVEAIKRSKKTLGIILRDLSKNLDTDFTLGVSAIRQKKGESKTAITGIAKDSPLNTGLLTKEDGQIINDVVKAYRKLLDIAKELKTTDNKERIDKDIVAFQRGMEEVEGMLKVARGEGGDSSKISMLVELYSDIAENLQKARSEFDKITQFKTPAELEKLSEKFETILSNVTDGNTPKRAIKDIKALANSLIKTLDKEIDVSKVVIKAGVRVGEKSLRELEEELAKIRKDKRELSLRFNFEGFVQNAQKEIDKLRFLDTAKKEGIDLMGLMERTFKGTLGELSFPFPLHEFNASIIRGGVFDGLKKEFEKIKFDADSLDLIKDIERKISDSKIKAEIILDPKFIDEGQQLTKLLREKLAQAIKGGNASDEQSVRRLLAKDQGSIIKELKTRLKNAIGDVKFDKLKDTLEKKVELAEAGIIPTGTDVVGTFSSRASLNTGAQALQLFKQQYDQLKKITKNTSGKGILL